MVMTSSKKDRELLYCKSKHPAKTNTLTRNVCVDDVTFDL